MPDHLLRSTRCTACSHRIDFTGNNDVVEHRSPAAQVWTHPNLEVRDSSLAGRGLFARQEIKVGEAVVRLGGRLVTTDELAKLFAVAETTGRYVDTTQLEADSHLVLPAGSAAHFGNHSCDPNLWYRGEFVLSARRDIARNEEATVDYATLSVVSSFSMECQCGASSCRRQVTGDDWRLHHLQERYGDHWTPAALALITPPR